MSLLWYWCWLLLIILDVFIGRNVRVVWFTFFVIYHTVCHWKVESLWTKLQYFLGLNKIELQLHFCYINKYSIR